MDTITMKTLFGLSINPLNLRMKKFILRRRIASYESEKYSILCNRVEEYAQESHIDRKLVQLRADLKLLK